MVLQTYFHLNETIPILYSSVIDFIVLRNTVTGFMKYGSSKQRVTHSQSRRRLIAPLFTLPLPLSLLPYQLAADFWPFHFVNPRCAFKKTSRSDLFLSRASITFVPSPSIKCPYKTSIHSWVLNTFKNILSE